MTRLVLIFGLVVSAAAAIGLSALTLVERSRLNADFDSLERLRDLRQAELSSRELILAIRNGYLDTFDGLVRISRDMDETFDALSSTDEALIHEARIHELLSDYRHDVDRFKRARSLLRNSLRYLPEAEEAAVRELEDFGDERLVTAVIRVAITISQPWDPASDLPRRIREISDAAPPGAVAVGQFIAHARVVAKSSQTVDEHIAALRAHRLADTLGSLVERFADRREQRSRRLAAIGLTASILSAFLLVGMGAALAALRRSSRALRETNEGLEETIRERSAELAHAQKMESIGQLAAGIAHEINTPSQFVADNLEFIDDSIKELTPVLEDLISIPSTGESRLDESPLREHAERADVEFLSKELPLAVTQSRDGIVRISEIVRAMKDFSHPGAEGFQTIDVNRAVESTVTVARNEWKYVAEVELDLDPELAPVRCNAGEINQCILNILVNASHAIGDRRAESEPLGNIRVTTRETEEQVIIEIADDGGGIPEEAQPRVFEPFFTTKGVGRGTGQGLSIAYSSIVERHGGSLDFTVEPGVGTTFSIGLPLASEHTGTDEGSTGETV